MTGAGVGQKISNSGGGGFTFWNFAANAGAFPVAATKGKAYVAEDDHGAIGDADYVQANTQMIANTAGANAFNEFNYK